MIGVTDLLSICFIMISKYERLAKMFCNKFLISRLYPCLVAIIIGTILSGCETGHATRVYKNLPPTSSKIISILYSNPANEYELIADSEMKNATEYAVKAWGAKMGADAVILSGFKTKFSSGGISSTSGVQAETVSLKSIGATQVFCSAIKYK